MRKLIILSISLLILVPLTAAPKEKKLLFIGNSFTYGYNLPWMVEALSAKLHKQLTPAACVKLFGKPTKISKNSGKITYTYKLEDEKILWLIFKQGKLSSATIDFKKLPMAEKF